jgi:hypothetical protein
VNGVFNIVFDVASEIKLLSDVYVKGGNAVDRESKPFSTAYVGTGSACAAANDVLAKAGVRPFDSVDHKYVNLMKLASCE